MWFGVQASTGGDAIGVLLVCGDRQRAALAWMIICFAILWNRGGHQRQMAGWIAPLNTTAVAPRGTLAAVLSRRIGVGALGPEGPTTPPATS